MRVVLAIAMAFTMSASAIAQENKNRWGAEQICDLSSVSEVAPTVNTAGFTAGRRFGVLPYFNGLVSAVDTTQGIFTRPSTETSYTGVRLYLNPDTGDWGLSIEIQGKGECFAFFGFGGALVSEEDRNATRSALKAVKEVDELMNNILEKAKTDGAPEP